jgi:uncharacterized repeat protein (TIGR01451 family)
MCCQRVASCFAHMVLGLSVLVLVMCEQTVQVAERQSASQIVGVHSNVNVVGQQARPALTSGVADATVATLQVINVKANAATVGRFEKFELTFDITGTVTSNLDWPYDPDPPPGLPAGVGITVDGLFSPDNWTTVYAQPAFLYQPYVYTVHNDRDHLYPTGEPEWKIRFAPPLTGTWRYRIRTADASGTTIYPADDDLTFTVVPSDNSGFLHVSPTDPRYFEFEDGTPFIGVGHGEGFGIDRPIQDAAEKFARFAANRADFFRVWMSGDSIFGSAWWPWASHHLGYDGYIPPTSLTSEDVYGNGHVSMKLGANNPCMFQGFTGAIPVLPGRTYRVGVRVKTVGVTGPVQVGEPYGFVIKLGGWLGQECSSAGVGIPVTPHVIDTGGAWRIITGTLATAADQYFLDNLYLSLSNVSSGVAYVDEVWVEERLGQGSYSRNILLKPKVNAHTYFDPARSWQWDRILDEAAAQGVYLKLVVLEKNEWIFNRITPSGTMTTTASNNNFYAAPDTAVRWLHQAWWRYLTARWGYSTAVHSWELLNEGDPFNGNHYDQAQAFAQYIHEHDPNRHMATTSNWHSLPVREFWGNLAYPDLDYADLHAYISTGWGEYPIWGNAPSSPLEFEDNPAHVRGGSGHSLRIEGSQTFQGARVSPSRLAIHGAGEWVIRFFMKAEGFIGSCPYSTPDTMAGPSLMWALDGGPFWGGRSNVVPPATSGQSFICSAPAGTYGWTSFDSVHDADGGIAPLTARLVITDNLAHSLYVAVHNSYGSGGIAWVDDIEIVAPDGTVLFTNGSVELDSMHEDAALYTAAYSLLWGGRSPAGARMPLVRGEAGLDHPGGPQQELDDLARDTEGVWLHNLIWGGINPGGMYDLYWWPSNIRNHDLYYHYKPYRDFMDGIPLNNGHYQDAGATVSHPDLRAWGQKDAVHGEAHLWIQSRNHTWRNVVDGVAIPGLSGQITIPGMKPGPYAVEWWDTYTGAIVETEAVEAGSNGLVLALPAPLTDDVAVKVSWMGPALGASTKTVNRFTAGPEDILTYTVSVVNSGAISVTAAVTDEIPANTSYVAGSADVTPDAGDLDDAAGIRWRGGLDSGERVTITFAVQVGPEQDPYVVSNVAVIEAGSERIERRALTIVNGRQVYLPMVLRSW